MNNRIKELALQAWTMVSDEERTNGELYEADRQQLRRDQVFAELIIRECIDVLDYADMTELEGWSSILKMCCMLLVNRLENILACTMDLFRMTQPIELIKSMNNTPKTGCWYSAGTSTVSDECEIPEEGMITFVK